MTPVHRLLIPAGLLLLIGCGAAGWRYAQQRGGYPDAVFYSRYLVLPTTGSAISQATYEEWVDPRRNRDLLRERDVAGTTTVLTRDGVAYQMVALIGGQTSVTKGIPATDAREQAAVDRKLLAGGWRQLYASAFGPRRGPVSHLVFLGRSALRSRYSGGVTLWSDARTGLPLQVRWDHAMEHITYRYLSWSRIAPGSLPADFFDPSPRQSSLWDQFTGWLRARVSFHQF